MSAQLCLASCFLPFDEENSAWWRRLQEALHAEGLDLVILGLGPSKDPALRVIQVPFTLQGYGQAYHTDALAEHLEPSLAQALIASDQAWCGEDEAPLDPFVHGLRTCQHVLRTLLTELQPALVLPWGSTLPQSVVLRELALQQGRPTWILERGLLPGTLMVEMAGQNGQSELNTSLALTHVQAGHDRTDLAIAAREAWHRTGASKYAQPTALDPASFAHRHNPDHRRVIAVLLQHDLASGLVPNSHLGARRHAPALTSSGHLLHELQRFLAKAPDCLAIVKPHPRDKGDYSRWIGPRLRVLPELNLQSLVQAADVVVAMTSTAQFEALLAEKPIVLAGRSPLANKGIAYEALAPDQLHSALRMALLQEGLPDRQAKAWRFLDFVLRHFSVGLDHHSPVGLSLRDLARFLAQNTVCFSGLLPLADRLQALSDWFQLWESAPESPARSAPTGSSVVAVPSGPTRSTTEHPLNLCRVVSLNDFTVLWRQRFEPLIAEQNRVLPEQPEPFSLPGYCVVCGREQPIATDFLFAGPDAQGRLKPSWRERQVCTCGLNCRQRSCFHVLIDHLGLGPDAALYCTEQKSSLFTAIRRFFPHAIGSEFLGPDFAPGSIHQGIRHEDITRLSFPDESLDGVFSLDVLEHVPDYQAGLRELARCLKPGGRLLLTAPFHFNQTATVVRARVLAGGALEHLLPPVYHGDPIHDGGALCFNDFGWDLLDDLRACGFTDAAVQVFSAEAYGYRGLQYVLMATRAQRDPSSRSRTASTQPICRSAPPSSPLDPSPEVLLQQAADLFAGGQLPAARLSCRRVLARHPASADGLALLAKTCQRLGLWKEAGDAWRQRSRLRPDDLETWQSWLWCTRRLGHGVLSDLIIEEALEAHPDWEPLLREPPDLSAPSSPQSSNEPEAMLDDSELCAVEGRTHEA